MRTRHIASAVVATALVFATIVPPSAAIEPPAVARKIEPGMVRVIVEDRGRRISASGFVVSALGHVVTNYHMIRPHVEADWQVFVVASGAPPEDRRPATVVETYPAEDLAVLHVAGLDRPPLSLVETDTDTPGQGATVFAIGYPGAGSRLGGESGTSFTAGMVNRLLRGAWTPDSLEFRIIQHSAPTNPGNSGGPIVNACGQVVGVNTERELAVVRGPAGLPVLTDIIQGVFFASHVSVLVETQAARDTVPGHDSAMPRLPGHRFDQFRLVRSRRPGGVSPSRRSVDQISAPPAYSCDRAERARGAQRLAPGPAPDAPAPF